MLINLLKKNVLNKILKFIKYKLVQNSRKKVLINEIYNLIKNDKDKVITINDFGSGYDNYVCLGLKNIFKNKKKIILNCYDNFSQNQIKYFKINYSINCYSIKKKFCIKKSKYILINDVLHHMFGTLNVNTFARIKKKTTEEQFYDKIKKLLLSFSRKTKYIIIKDHYQKSFFDVLILKISDFIGNFYYGLKTPSIYLNKKKFEKSLHDNNFVIIKKRMNVRYYSKWFFFFSAPKLHFLYLIKAK
jgi:hypothetical protein